MLSQTRFSTAITTTFYKIVMTKYFFTAVTNSPFLNDFVKRLNLRLKLQQGVIRDAVVKKTEYIQQSVHSTAI